MKRYSVKKDNIIFIGLGERIRAARGDASQEAVAQKAGMTRGRLSMIEAGKANITVGTLNRIALALGVEASSLILSQADKPSIRGL